MSINVKPEDEARARLHGARVCPQCLGAGVFRTLITKGGKTMTVMTDCPRCIGKKAKP